MSESVSTKNKNFNKFYNNTQNVHYILILILISLQILSGVIFIIFTEFYKSSLTKYVGNFEKGQLQTTFSMMDLFGIQIILINLCGIPIARKLYKDSFTEHLCLLIKLWIGFSFLIIISGFVLFWTIYHSSPLLERSFEQSLYNGIDLYYDEPEWRLIWDDMQYHQQCCGVKNYTDWQAVVLRKEEDDFDLNKRETFDEIVKAKHLTLIPYSCCKVDNDCFKNFQPSSTFDSWLEIPTLEISSINTQGCYRNFSQSLNRILMIYFGLFLEIFIVEILILVLLRLLFTNNQNGSSTVTFSCEETIELETNLDHRDKQSSKHIEISTDIEPNDNMIYQCVCGVLRRSVSQDFSKAMEIMEENFPDNQNSELSEYSLLLSIM